MRLSFAQAHGCALCALNQKIAGQAIGRWVILCLAYSAPQLNIVAIDPITDSRILIIQRIFEYEMRAGLQLSPAEGKRWEKARNIPHNSHQEA